MVLVVMASVWQNYPVRAVQFWPLGDKSWVAATAVLGEFLLIDCGSELRELWSMWLPAALVHPPPLEGSSH
jgi:hypothetical protein